ncbi:MAG: FkbM family methyltransferase [Chloroherpetonaceae bacterium]
MTELVKKPLRALFRAATRLYPREYGKYSLLMKFYFPYLAPLPPSREVVTLSSGIRMDLELNEYVQSQLYLFGNFEPATVKVLKRLLKSGDMVLDIGANVGYIALEMAKCVGASGKVFAFEPDAKNFALLKRNLELNPDCNIEPIALAVSDTNAPLRLYKSIIDFNDSAHSTLPSEKHSVDFIEIPTTTIDDFVQSRGVQKLNAIKIDIEGAEMSAFRGMRQTLSRFRPIVISELCAEHQARAGYTTQSVKEWIATNVQMQPFKISESGTLHKVKLEEEHVADNVAFIPSERIREVQPLIS